MWTELFKLFVWGKGVLKLVLVGDDQPVPLNLNSNYLIKIINQCTE